MNKRQPIKALKALTVEQFHFMGVADGLTPENLTRLAEKSARSARRMRGKTPTPTKRMQRSAALEQARVYYSLARDLSA